MSATDTLKQIQALLGVEIDGVSGTKTNQAFATLCGHAEVERAVCTIHSVKASSFADPADVKAFGHCKMAGKSDVECFRVGDNAIGLWGDSTAEGTGTCCALPPEDWQPFYHLARGKKVLVKANDKEVVCELRDTMPHKAAITNGAGIDLNPDACKALGLTPPIMVAATWQWV